jgi:oligopeptide transport system permease protein
MLFYAIRRVLGAIPTLFIIITLSFFLMRLAPGGPFATDRVLPPEIARNIAAAYDLDKPLWQQFLIYLGRLAHGDFGPSYKIRDFSVTQLIMNGFPVSMKLGLLAITLAVAVGTTMGIIAALRQNRPADYSVMTLAMVGITIPAFVTAPLLQLVFGIYGLHIFGLNVSLPVGGWNGGAAQNIILPVIVLSLGPIAVIARITRGSMVEVLRSNFIRTARAKGLPTWRVITHHALHAGLLPLVSYLGPAIADIVSGSLIVEQIFSLPGIGRYFVQAALNRDYTLVMGVTIFYAALIITLNLVVDLLYGVLDPRVRYK